MSWSSSLSFPEPVTLKQEKPLLRPHFTSLFPSNFLTFTLSSSSLPSPPFPFLLGDPLGLLCLTHYCLQVLTFFRSGLIRRLSSSLEFLCQSKNSRCSHWTGLCHRCHLNSRFLGLAVFSSTVESYLDPLVRIFTLFCFYFVTQTQQVLQVFCSNFSSTVFTIHLSLISPLISPVSHGESYYWQSQQHSGSCIEFHAASALIRPQSWFAPAASICRHVRIPLSTVLPQYASIIRGFLQPTVSRSEQHGGCVGSGGSAVAGGYRPV